MRTATGDRGPAAPPRAVTQTPASRHIPAEVAIRPISWVPGPPPRPPPDNSSRASPAASVVRPARAARCTALARGGWPDSAATTGTRATVRAGWRAASMAVMTASAIPVMITPQGSASGSITWPVAACRRGTYTSQAQHADAGGIDLDAIRRETTTILIRCYGS
jgi:hypothetical protein